MPTHPLFWLVFVTFGLLIAVLGWNYISTRRRQKHGPDVKGMGSDNDPLK